MTGDSLLLLAGDVARAHDLGEAADDILVRHAHSDFTRGASARPVGTEPDGSFPLEQSGSPCYVIHSTSVADQYRRALVRLTEANSKNYDPNRMRGLAA